MASCASIQTLAVFIFLFLGVNVNCSQDSAVTVTLGYIFTHPRNQHLKASKVVLTNEEKDLKLICTIDPPLSRSVLNDLHRDEVVEFVKVAPEYRILHSTRYWPDEQTSTAVSIVGSYMDQLGTYACSYRGIWSYIDLVADEGVTKRLPTPVNMVDLEEFVMYRADRSSVPGWSNTQPAAQAEGAAFHCVVPRSKQSPSSVHKLLPSQVNVVAAMGDSITAAVAGKATGIQNYFIQDRGISWSIGGDGSLGDSITLPNILKKFSAHVRGYSQGEGHNYSANTQFNVARAGATARDLPTQAQILAHKMKTSLDINYEEDWKIITVLSGQEDLCRVCMDKDTYSPSSYVQSVIQALKELQKIPRVLVNLVLPFDVSLLKKLRNGNYQCKVLNVDACPCLDSRNANLTFISEMHKEYTTSVTQFVESGMFDHKDDFTVVVRPVFDSVGSESLDRGLFSIDCYHLSWRGHSLAALNLWNNMMEGNKRIADWSGQPSLKCPTKKQPYISTRLNREGGTSGSNYSQQESDKGGVPLGVVVFLSIFLGGVFILIVGLVYRTRKSRPRNDSLLSLINNPHRAKI